MKLIIAISRRAVFITKQLVQKVDFTFLMYVFRTIFLFSLRVYYILFSAQEYDKRAKSLISQRNALMSQANDSRNFVDLHLMSVPAAIKLLKEKLNCLDNRKLVVVTGYGKSSIGAVKIKPAVLQWLNQLHYE
uniref:Smr domain-containing protein n=1 Tax=Syphacia muris TaxID=451379 RepID=A0A0N5AL00_9BILA